MLVLMHFKINNIWSTKVILDFYMLLNALSRLQPAVFHSEYGRYSLQYEEKSPPISYLGIALPWPNPTVQSSFKCLWSVEQILMFLNVKNILNVKNKNKMYILANGTSPSNHLPYSMQKLLNLRQLHLLTKDNSLISLNFKKSTEHPHCWCKEFPFFSPQVFWIKFLLHSFDHLTSGGCNSCSWIHLVMPVNTFQC